MRILFWGTPAFSLPALRAILGEGHEVVGVVTQPDRPAGRGHALTSSPVKKLALDEALLVLQPERARGPEFVAEIRALEPDLSVVVAFGQILRREVIDAPRLGTINVHASLLPELRGAAPIQWSIIRGHEQTGVTIMRIVEALDAGPMIYQVPEPIGPEETARDLAVRVAELGAEALVEALALLEADAVHEEPQDDARATFAPRLTRDDAHIDFARSAAEVDRWIRGMDDVPGAWAQLGFMLTSDKIDFFGADRELTASFRPYLSRPTFERAQIFSWRAYMLVSLVARLPMSKQLPALKRMRRNANKLMMVMLQAHILHRLYVAEPPWALVQRQADNRRANAAPTRELVS